MYAYFPYTNYSHSKLNRFTMLYFFVLLIMFQLHCSLSYLVLPIFVGEGTFEDFYYRWKYISCHHPNCCYCPYYKMHKQKVGLNFKIRFTNVKCLEKALEERFRNLFILTSCFKFDYKNMNCRSLPSGQNTGYVEEYPRSSLHCQCKFILSCP